MTAPRVAVSTAELTARVERGCVGVVRRDVALEYVRADVLEVRPEELIAYEIKGSSDSLRRLARQVHGYSAVADRCVLVVTPSHLGPRLDDRLPAWWGLTVSDEAVGLRVLREPAPSPSVSAGALARLLWSAQAEQLLDEVDALRGYRGATRARLAERIAERVPLDRIRAVVREALAQRGAGYWTPARPWGDP